MYDLLVHPKIHSLHTPTFQKYINISQAFAKSIPNFILRYDTPLSYKFIHQISNKDNGWVMIEYLLQCHSPHMCEKWISYKNRYMILWLSPLRIWIPSPIDLTSSRKKLSTGCHTKYSLWENLSPRSWHTKVSTLYLAPSTMILSNSNASMVDLSSTENNI